MLRRRSQRTSDDGERGNALSQLLVSEEQLATRLAQARDEAERILSDAADYVKAVESGSARLITERTSALQSHLQLELEAQLETIRATAERERATFARVADQRMPELVARVLTRIAVVDDEQWRQA